MNLDEINASPAYDLLLKLRKGMAASLNATKLAGVFAVLNSGWKIEKTSFYKLSAGGWVIKELGVKTFHKSWLRDTDGRIHLVTTMPRPLDQYADFGDTTGARQKSYRDEAVSKLENLQRIEANLRKLQTAPEKGKWFVRDVQSGVVQDPEHKMISEYVVTFEFYVKCSGFVITSPDGQTYEVFGDHKNGAVAAQTFPGFFAWAVENTSIMDEILGVLQMEPHEKKHDPKSRYVPLPGSSAGTLRVFDILKGLTDGVRAEQKANLITRFKRAVMNFHDAVQSGDKQRVRALSSSYDAYTISQCYDSRKKDFAEGWEATIDRIAEREVEEMQNMFVYKNTGKLAPILDRKGGNETVDVLFVRGETGVITSALKFTFADGSSFRVDQSIVGSHSVYGRPFYRFPTTFHDVVLADGTKMGLPSEERMNEIFAKA